jgi:hypothetical protein
MSEQPQPTQDNTAATREEASIVVAEPVWSWEAIGGGLRDVLLQLAEVMRPAAEWFVRNQDAILQGIAQFSQWAAELPEATRAVLTVMAADGWFLDNAMPASLPYDYAAHIRAGRATEATALMREHFTERQPAILEELCRHARHRAPLLETAFAAVLRGEHALAIPVLFAQVDGLCHDVIKGSAFFVKDRRTPVVCHLADDGSDLAADLANAFLAPFGADLPIMQSKRPPGFSTLNRHQVLHGESVDYGTADNSLRAISLLAYTAQRLQDKGHA